MPDDNIETSEQMRLLKDLLTGDEDLPLGQCLGLPNLPPGDYWVDIAGACVLCDVQPGTITGWLVKGGPARRPFPNPFRLMYRLYWKRSEIDLWLSD
ncbi:hypothetical protein FHU30_002526 [Actinomadura rupiterrae]|nr:hypothetical protein [Actinomadura rupiterrae]